MIDSGGWGGGGGVNYQMQIVTTKLPNENIQTYQLQMTDSWVGGGNYQMQVVTSFLSLTCEMVFVTSFLSLTCESVCG